MRGLCYKSSCIQIAQKARPLGRKFRVRLIEANDEATEIFNNQESELHLNSRPLAISQIQGLDNNCQFCKNSDNFMGFPTKSFVACFTKLE